MIMVPITAYLALAAILFGIGASGVLISRNLIIQFISIQLMLNAANLTLIACLCKIKNLASQLTFSSLPIFSVVFL